MRSSSDRWRLQIGGHVIEVLDEPPQLVGGGGGDTGVEIAAGDPPRGAREPADRVGDAFRHPVADPGAEQHEKHGGEHHAAIELVDLLLDLLLAQGLRNGDDALAAAGAHRRRGNQVPHPAHFLLGDKGRQAVHDDASIDLSRGARGEQSGRVQVALARRLKARAGEQIDVLVDRPS